MNCGKPKPLQGMVIRSQAWSGMGDQDGSETSGVSPNNNPRLERPASRVLLVAIGDGEGEIVRASRKRGGT